MFMFKPIFVIDTNILIDYVDIIPNGTSSQPEEPTVNLSHAHIVIPTAVIRELSNFKKEKTDRGKAARTALKRIRAIAEKTISSVSDIYKFDAPTEFHNGEQLISIHPVHANFKNCLPYRPSDSDMDGQIILATLSIIFSLHGFRIDGTAPPNCIDRLKPEQKVILLTNDNGLATRASRRGIFTSRYGYKYPEPYTGRRNLFVPKAIFHEFWNSSLIAREFWEQEMPNAPKLVANEFIIMELENPAEYPKDFDASNNYYWRNIGRYDTTIDAIVPLHYIDRFPTRITNPGQAIYAEALANPQLAAVICTGPAGSGKTYMSTIYGYNACQNGDYIGVTVVPCEDHNDIGALPGDLDEKMDPDIQPFKNAIRNYLLKEDCKFRKELKTLQKFGAKAKPEREHNDEEPPEKKSIKAKLKDRVDLIWQNWFSSIPINKARGRDFSYELAIYDEFQDQNHSQADTLIKRIGEDGKIIITGDVYQVHSPFLDSENNGLVYASQLLLDHPMVAQVHFREEEVVRHPLVREIAKRQKAKHDDRPMS